MKKRRGADFSFHILPFFVLVFFISVYPPFLLYTNIIHLCLCLSVLPMLSNKNKIMYLDAMESLICSRDLMIALQQ